MPVHPVHGGPTHCRSCGEPMDHPNVNVGWTGCGCGQPHRTWRCEACRYTDCKFKPPPPTVTSAREM